jgi:hypothetical protein
VASVKNLPQLPESKTIQTAETPPAILENTEEKNPKKSAADIIAEEKILSSQMPKENPIEKITDNKWASMIIIVCGSFFLIAMGVIIISQIRLSRRRMYEEE